MSVAHLQAASIDSTFLPDQTAVFMDVPSSESGRLTMRLDPFAELASLQAAIDLNGDGVSEKIQSPTFLLDAQESKDITMPKSNISIQGKTGWQNYYTGVVTATITASDSGTGVFSTEYSLDDGKTWEKYLQSVSFIAEKTPTLYVRSVDNAGNQEYPWPRQQLYPYIINIPVVSN